MNTVANTINKAGLLAGVSALVAFSGSSLATPLNLPDLPLFLPESVPPLNMLVLGRDHKLYYEAYNDYTDLNDDGVLDLKYKPAEIDYYGYFDSFKCYSYDGGTERFNPTSYTSNKKCSGRWSGDWLNYLTTSRIDALRKVLYGGFRQSDTDTTTFLERSHIPQNAHSWGKEYRSVAVDGYDITEYTPLALPTGTSRHLFANVTPLNNPNQGKPLLRVLQNRSERIWEWVSIERAVAGRCLRNGELASGDCRSGATSVTPTDYRVRVAVCVANLLEPNCQLYPNGNHKPIGLLQEFGENNSMYFGLLTGSYSKNTSGGVLRRGIGSMRDEINWTTDGTFRDFAGIIRTLNGLRNTGFGGEYAYNCGWITTRAIGEGECQMWGNPVGEMLYEALRYFAGRSSPTSAFSITAGAGEESELHGGSGLPVVASWTNPYQGRPVCSKPFQTVVSDINPSYDTDQLPGTAFGSFGGDTLGGLNVSTIGQKIWDVEFNGPRNVFIGQSGDVSDGAPTAKLVTSFGNIRGLSPEEPTKQGGYYSASVAHYGRITELGQLNPLAGSQTVNTFSVALASPLPKIEIPIAGRTITFVPFAKSVAGSSISATSAFQPTNQIVDFYVEEITPTRGRFQVNFEDVEQGADHDMDAIVVYEYEVINGQLRVQTYSTYAAGGIEQHMGYIISGTTQDGVYLEVRDCDTANSGGSDPTRHPSVPASACSGNNPATATRYRLDTPTAASLPGQCATSTCPTLPLSQTRWFTPGSTPGAELLKDPLWYAAKWGGFTETHLDPALRTNMPDDRLKWDANDGGDGVPDNYFLVTNALKLSEQLRKAFRDILRRTTSSSSASVNSGTISSDTRVYQARFNTGEWTGELLSFQLDPASGALVTPHEWDASEKLPPHGSRQIITVNSDRTPAAFRWSSPGSSLDENRQAALGDATLGPRILDYIRGDGQYEGQGADNFRERPTKLGDIVSSAPLFVGRPPFRYRDSLETPAYSTFAAQHSNRRGMVYVGANDGMLHGFDAVSGEEVFGFIPSPVFNRLPNLASQNYSHEFYVDGSPSMGDAYFGSAWRTVLVGGLNKGGQGIYALDITNPATTLANAEGNPGSVVLWEFTDADDPDLGLTFSQPAIVRLQNGRWAAVFGNGYNNTLPDGNASVTGNAVLFIKEFGTGTVYKLDTGAGLAQAPNGIAYDNGLSTPALVDIDGDRIVEYAYAGDLYGNMWKFDLRTLGTAPAPAPFLLYRARDEYDNPQPITVRPEVGRGPGGAGMIVLFGTGKYLENSDKELDPTRIQSFYGIVDRNTGTSEDRVDGRDSLTRQEILLETSVDFDGEDGPLDAMNIRVTSDNTLGANSGWYLDLLSPSGYQGEKQVSNPIIRNGNVIFTTLIPDPDPCAFGGTSWLMELSMLDGSRLRTTPFDLNNDGQFTDADNVTITLTLEDGTTVEISVPVSGLGSTQGILQSPGVIDGEMVLEGVGRPVQYKYLPGSEGGIQRVTENPGVSGTGRQSWRQVR